MGAPSEHHLCKTIVFENTHFSGSGGGGDDLADSLNSRYYFVVVQYTGKLNTDKLAAFVRELKDNQLPKKRYNFRLANEEVCDFFRSGLCGRLDANFFIPPL